VVSRRVRGGVRRPQLSNWSRSTECTGRIAGWGVTEYPLLDWSATSCLPPATFNLTGARSTELTAAPSICWRLKADRRWCYRTFIPMHPDIWSSPIQLPSQTSVHPVRVSVHSYNNRVTAGRSGLVVSASDCGLRGPGFESHCGRLCLSRWPLRYAALSTGCAPLLQCLGHPSLASFLGR